MSDVKQEEAVIFQEKPKALSPVDMLSKLRSWLEKYGYTFDDSNLVDVIESIKLKKIAIGLENDQYQLYDLEHMVDPNKDKQRILVFPRGKHYIQKYDKWLNFDDKFFNEIAESFECEDLVKPFIDKNHELRESFGDVIGYQTDTEGMYFEIRLNNEGKELVKENSYKYHSPSFGSVIDTKGNEHVNALVSVSLTNIPALMSSIPVLQEQLELEKNSKPKKRRQTMNLKELTQKLELQEEASITAIAEAVQKLMDEGVEKAQIVDELKATIAKLTEDKAQVEEAMNKVNEELSTIKQAELQKSAESTIDLAIKDGQYHPALKDLKIKQFIANKDEVQKELEVIPKLKEGQQSSISHEDETKLTNEDKEIMISLDMDPSNEDDKKTYLEANKDDVRYFDGNIKKEEE